MSNLLFVTSSLFGQGSKSRLVGAEFVENWRAAYPDTIVRERDLMPGSMPHLSQDVLAALALPAEQRSAAQQAGVALADALIEELEQADVIVIAAPMYNFTIPSTLKAWIDHIARAGRTFRYGPAGPEGLLTGKKVFVVTGRGGVYSGDSPAKSFDFQEPYLRSILGYLGLRDVSFVHAEGLNLGPEAAATGLARARAAIGTILPATRAA